MTSGVSETLASQAHHLEVSRLGGEGTSSGVAYRYDLSVSGLVPYERRPTVLLTARVSP